jgi:hypothetical protein
MFDLDQSSILQRLRDLLAIRLQENRGDLLQGAKFSILDIFTFVLGKAEQKYGPMRCKADQQTKSTSLSFPRPCDSLFDDLTAKIGID